MSTISGEKKSLVSVTRQTLRRPLFVRALVRAGSITAVLLTPLLPLVDARPASASTSVHPCRTSALAVTLGAPTKLASTSWMVVAFTNVSASRCTLLGTPGVQPLSGTPLVAIGPRATSSGTKHAKTVVLGVHGVAYALFGVGDTATYAQKACVPKVASALLIRVDHSSAAMVTMSFNVCSKASSTAVLPYSATAPKLTP